MKEFLLLFGSLLFISCSTKITCPQISNENTSKIALLDHGKHSSLIIEDSDKMVRYAYGDWEYYALGKPSFWNGVKALFWSTQAGLGKKILQGPVSETNIKTELKVLVDGIYIFDVETTKTKTLLKNLDKLHQTHKHNIHYNQKYDLNFVRLPESYWLFNNSNQKTAWWIESLGCRAKGLALVSIWQ
ncbi:MAG: hypothetical protein ACOCUH_02105 [Bacteriovoracia bacterium]